MCALLLDMLITSSAVCDGDLCFYFGHVLANQRCTSQAVTLSTMLRFAIYSRQICIVTVT